MHFHSQYAALCLFVVILAFSSSTASFCSDLIEQEDLETPCFLEPATHNSVLLRTSGNSLILPCHVARSKGSVVEWWYTDPERLVNIKIYPVFPTIRPTVLRFTTTLTSQSKKHNETDILDASILLRHVNVDDTGVYRCVIRPWTADPISENQDVLVNSDANLAALTYQVQLTGPRLCQTSSSTLPCFSAMRTSSPTIIDAYQTAFLPCVINNYNRPVSVFWVVGNASINNVLVTDYLSTNSYQGDRLRRVFPLSPFDYSIELVVNRTAGERTYSCVIDGATDVETTLFTYIVRAIEVGQMSESAKNSTSTKLVESERKLAAHDTLNHKQINSMRRHKKVKTNDDDLSIEHDPLDLDKREESRETSTSSDINDI